MRKRYILLLLSISVLFLFSGCEEKYVNRTGKVYDEPDIDREELLDDVGSASLGSTGSLIAEAEKAANAMGSYISAQKVHEMEEVKRAADSVRTEIKAFQRDFPEINLDTALPKTEISDEALTWIQGILEEMEKEDAQKGQI